MPPQWGAGDSWDAIACIECLSGMGTSMGENQSSWRGLGLKAGNCGWPRGHSCPTKAGCTYSTGMRTPTKLAQTNYHMLANRNMSFKSIRLRVPNTWRTDKHADQGRAHTTQQRTVSNHHRRWGGGGEAHAGTTHMHTELQQCLTLE